MQVQLKKEDKFTSNNELEPPNEEIFKGAPGGGFSRCCSTGGVGERDRSDDKSCLACRGLQEFFSLPKVDLGVQSVQFYLNFDFRSNYFKFAEFFFPTSLPQRFCSEPLDPIWQVAVFESALVTNTASTSSLNLELSIHVSSPRQPRSL